MNKEQKFRILGLANKVKNIKLNKTLKTSSDNKHYTIHKTVGNFSDKVFESDNFYEIQDYLEDEWVKYADEERVGYDDEREKELFMSYFTIEESAKQKGFVVIDEDGKVYSYLKDRYHKDFLDTVDEPDGGYSKAVIFKSEQEADFARSNMRRKDDTEVVSVDEAFAFVEESSIGMKYYDTDAEGNKLYKSTLGTQGYVLKADGMYSPTGNRMADGDWTILEDKTEEVTELSTRYNLYDKYTGKYLYDINCVGNKSELISEAQGEWTRHNEEGEYMEYDFPETADEAYEYLKSLYNIDIEE